LKTQLEEVVLSRFFFMTTVQIKLISITSNFTGGRK